MPANRHSRSLTNRGTAFTVEKSVDVSVYSGASPVLLKRSNNRPLAHTNRCRLDDDLDKYIYLEQLHDRNEVLYYKVIIDHLAEALSRRLTQRSTGHQEMVRRLPPLARHLPSVDRIEDVRPTFEGLGLEARTTLTCSLCV